MNISTPKVEILVVDDDRDYRVLIRHQLEGAGYQVLESADGQSAFAVLGRQYIPLVILDIVMPDVEGIELITRLRRQGCRSKILAAPARRWFPYRKIAQFGIARCCHDTSANASEQIALSACVTKTMYFR